MSDKELIAMAEEASKSAYTPYSHFNVGAAILTASGRVYTGCNVENASFGATICAERCAAVKAVSGGDKEFLKIAIISSSGTYTHPCGICRQFLAEFAAKDCVFVLNDNTDGVRTIPFSEEFPSAFTEF